MEDVVGAMRREALRRGVLAELVRLVGVESGFAGRRRGVDVPEPPPLATDELLPFRSAGHRRRSALREGRGRWLEF